MSGKLRARIEAMIEEFNGDEGRYDGTRVARMLTETLRSTGGQVKTWDRETLAVAIYDAVSKEDWMATVDGTPNVAAYNVADSLLATGVRLPCDDSNLAELDLLRNGNAMLEAEVRRLTPLDVTDRLESAERQVRNLLAAQHEAQERGRRLDEQALEISRLKDVLLSIMYAARGAAGGERE